MSNSEPHPASPDSRSQIIYKSVPAKTSPVSDDAAPAFSAANASLQTLSGAPRTSPAEVEVETVPQQLSALEAAPVALEAAPVAGEVGPVQVQVETISIATPAQNVLPREVVREAKGHRGARRGRGVRAAPAVWLGAGLGALLLVAGGAAAGAYSNFASGQTIAPNVFIGGVPVGGLSLSAAKARLTSHFGSPRLTLVCDDKKIPLPIDQLGAHLGITRAVKRAFTIGRAGSLPNNLLRVYGGGTDDKNLPLPIEWNKTRLVAGLRAANAQIAVAPVDARLRAAPFGLEVVPDRAGRELNIGSAAHLLQRRYGAKLASLHVPSQRVEAKVSARSLEGRDVQLAQYTTRFNAGLAGRTQNIRIACRAIQNHVLMPGETFSFNACTGERTAPKGYQMAHIFLRQPGEDEPEVVEGLAGGVCQVSSTLFNAVRKTNAAAEVNPIKIVERNTHSLPVTYVPPGLDATVAWPYKDFKFRNITDHPVYVRTQVGRSKLSISLWGRVPRA